MKKFKVSTVNKAIAAAGVRAELVRGDGFYELVSGEHRFKVDVPSIMAYSLDEWVRLAEGHMWPHDATVITDTNLLPDDGSPVTEEDLIVAQTEVPDPMGIRAAVAAGEAETQKQHGDWRLYSLTFRKVEHGVHLQECIDALTSIGCRMESPETWSVDFEREFAQLWFRTTMSRAEVKELLAFTSVTL